MLKYNNTNLGLKGVKQGHFYLKFLIKILKEIGDVENWSKVMERDVIAITNILEQTKNKN